VLGLAAWLTFKLALIEAWLERHHLEHVSEVCSTYLFNWRVYSVALLPALALERAFPLEKRRPFSPNVLVDWSIPIFDGVLWGGFVNGAGALITKAYLDDTKPFFALGLLDDAHPVTQAIGAYLTVTLVAYTAHRLLHAVPFLWHFHAVHHSQTKLNPFCTKRAHLVEDLFTLALAIVPMGIVGGSYPTWLWIPILNGFWSYLIHANARTNLGPLKWIVVSPQAHRIHHSTDPRHYNKNFTTEITLWDHVFRTAYTKFDEYPEATGISGFPIPEPQGHSPLMLLRQWWALTVYPFRAIGRDVVRLTVRIRRR
jgi:sterol desaturase/sphingolipid hydroxylase (fatty acid hydroxylase superfamily)